MGQVVDASSGKPVAGSTVSINAPVPAPGAGGAIMGVAPAAGPPASVAPRQVLTDSQGRFLFHDLSKGRYTIRATAPGYLGGMYGQNRPSGTSQPLELPADDSKQGNVVVKVWKTASISGTIVDDAGEPVVGLGVNVLRRTITNGKPRLATYSTATTDDRGMYRSSGLPPDDYLVALMSTQVTMPASVAEAYRQAGASEKSVITSDVYRELSSSGAPAASTSGYRVGDLVFQSGYSGRGGGGVALPAPADEGRVSVYPTQFYPSATATAQATVISLASGDERSGIDLQLKLAPAVRVSGIVTGPDGPVKNFGVKLLPPGAEDFVFDSGTESAMTATDATGAFTFLGVPPGQYTLKCLRIPRPATAPMVPSSITTIEITGPNGLMMGMGSSSGSASAQPAVLPADPTLWAILPVTVGDADVTGLAVMLRPGARIGGRIEFEATREKPAPDQLQRASIRITPATGPDSSQLSSGTKRVEGDGRFNSVGYPAGKYVVSASIPAAAGGAAWSLKSVIFDGHDVSEDGLDVTGEDITSLVITFTDHASQVSGTVIDAKGQPDRMADVIFIPADSQGWKQGVMNANSRRLRNVRTSSTGAYDVTGLPIGDYFVAAVSDESLGDWQAPKVLQAIVGVATRITLGDGEKKTLQLTTKSIR
jgi:hypothetical protein